MTKIAVTVIGLVLLLAFVIWANVAYYEWLRS